jgi:hypothetical protein
MGKRKYFDYALFILCRSLKLELKFRQHILFFERKTSVAGTSVPVPNLSGS